MLAIYKREMRSYFTTAIGYVFTALFLIVSGFLFSLMTLQKGASSNFYSYFSILIFLFIVIIPLLTMKIVSEERKTKTDQLLFTAPVTLTEIVAAKHFAAMTMFSCTFIVSALANLLLLIKFGTPNIATYFGNIVAVLLVGSAFIAIGIFVSSLTENQFLSAFMTIVTILILLLLGSINSYITVYPIRVVFSYFSILSSYASFSAGLFDFIALAYYISITVLFLFLTVRVFERRRWASEKSRRIKYGSISTAYTVVVLAALIIINAVLASLGSVNPLTVDMTEKKLYLLSEEAVDTYDNLLLEREDVSFEIIFMSEKDIYETSQVSAYNSYNTEVGIYKGRNVLYTANEIAQKYENVSISFIDSARHPEEVKKYISVKESDSVASTDVIISCVYADGTRAPAQKLSLSSFYSNIYANVSTGDVVTGIKYAAEQKFANTFKKFLVATEEKPIAYFTQGHAEPALENIVSFTDVLEYEGFEVRSIKLNTEEGQKEWTENLSRIKLLIINDPRTDISGVEYDTIKQFVDSDQTRGNLIVTSGSAATATKMPLLDSLMEKEYGIKFSHAVLDDTEALASSGGTTIFADYTSNVNILNSSEVSNDNKVGSNFLQPILNDEKTLNLEAYFEKPREVIIRNSAIEKPSDYIHTRHASSMLFSHSTAYSVDEDGVRSYGTKTLMAINRMWRNIGTTGQNDERINYVLAIGTANFLDQSTTINESIMKLFLSEIYSDSFAIEITAKTLDNTALEISNGQATAWTIVLCTVLPLCVLVPGAIIFIRRRHS